MAATRVLIVFGTRPEAIKLAPVIRECRDRDSLDTIVCSTGQHREMLSDVVGYFGLEPKFSLDIMCPNASLSQTTASCLKKLDAVIGDSKPDFVVAQGDTLSVLAASLAAYFRGIRFVHVEAGLRTGDLSSPWPEEFNRRVASISTAIHCVPTQDAADNLLAENVDPSTVHITGNTVVDALLWTIERERHRDSYWESRHPQIQNRRMVLITGHRRENTGERFVAICQAIRHLSELFPDIEFVYPVHLSPAVRKPAFEMLAGHSNISLLDPLSYPEFVWLMSRAEVILTDSGGIQEEAPTLKKQVLLMRDTSERPEAVKAGFTKIVGFATESIIRHTSDYLSSSSDNAWPTLENPYGDGFSAQRIADLIVSR